MQRQEVLQVEVVEDQEAELKSYLKSIRKTDIRKKDILAKFPDMNL